jgi:outer membrane protein assembly factor BamB
MKRYFSVMLILAAALVAANYEWPMFRQNRFQHSRQNGLSNLGIDTLRWQDHTGTSISAGTVMGDVTQDNIAEVVAVSDAGMLYVYNGKTGTLAWSFSTGAAVKSTPAIGDMNGDGVSDIVCGSHDKKLYVLSGTGSIIWQKTFPAKIENPIMLFEHESELKAVVSSGDTLYCMNGDGSVMWHWTPPLGNYFINGTPSAADVDADGMCELFVVAADFRNSCLVASLEGDDGSTRWYTTYDKRMSADNSLVDVDGDNDLEIIFGLRNGMLLCLEALDGDSVWAAFLADNDRAVTPMAVGDMNEDGLGDIVFGTNDDVVYALRGYDGHIIWSYTTGSSVSSAPVLGDINGDDTLDVVFGTGARYLCVIQNANLRWQHLMDGVITGSPSLADVDADDVLDIAAADLSGCIKVFGETEHLPIPPYIYVAKSENKDSIVTYWESVSVDTLGDPITVKQYDLYSNTQAGYIPQTGDFLSSPTDTYYVEPLPDENRNYLNHTISIYLKSSAKSNMGFVLHRSVVENASASDRNWISVPWHSEYSTVSDLTDDLSPAGDPLVRVTDLRDDQLYQNWIWDPDFLEWGGVDFAIEPGRGYEVETVDDDTLLLVGSNDPDGLISLTYNATGSDRNWVALPYNAVYSTVSDVTDEYAAVGDPVIRVTDLRDDQLYQNWIWDPDFLEWGGVNFAIEPGRGYEFEVGVTHDTTFNPTEYSNAAVADMLARRRLRSSDVECVYGTVTEPIRAPAWCVAVGSDGIGVTSGKAGGEYHPVSLEDGSVQEREPGVPHVVRLRFGCEGMERIVFTAYRPDRSFDVLTESTIGSGTMVKDGSAAVWFEVGNFISPWQQGEEVVVIVEALKQNAGYAGVVSVILDTEKAIQEEKEIVLERIPEPSYNDGVVSWHEQDNVMIMGYSVYEGSQRLNSKIITGNTYTVSGDVVLRPVVIGGYETVYGSCEALSASSFSGHAFAVRPNPFSIKTCISFAVSHKMPVGIKVYDVTGTLVRTLLSKQCEPGIYTVSWYGDDDRGKSVASGVYFISEDIQGIRRQHKIVVVH